LTRTAFARREGIRYSTFCTWAQAERQQGKLPVARAGRPRQRRAGAPTVRFAEVRLPAVAAPVPGLEVRLPGWYAVARWERGGTGGPGAGLEDVADAGLSGSDQDLRGGRDQSMGSV